MATSAWLCACAATPLPSNVVTPLESATASPPVVAAPAPPMSEAQCDERIEEIRGRAAADRDRARDDYAASCEAGCGDGCWAAGSIQHRGPPGRRDDAKAFAYYQRACAAKSGIGCAALAFSYRMGWGTARSFDEAKRYYRMGCDMNFGPACGGLGDMFETQTDGAPDSAEAARDYLRACELRDGGGCDGAGQLYAKGRGVVADDRRALALYDKGCDYGSALACARAGDAAAANADPSPDKQAALRARVDSTYRRGAELARASCDRGDPQGCSILGDAYRAGKGVPRDVEIARRLYRIGCDGQMGLGCAGLRALGDVPSIDGTASGALASASTFDCARVRCRDQSKVQLYDNAGHAFEVSVPSSPYVPDAIVLFPGDDFYVTGDEQDGRLVNLRYVDPPAAPSRVLHVQFSQRKIGESYSMLLEVQSYFPRWTSYHALTHQVSRAPRELRQTTTCPIGPMIHATEMWPDLLSSIRLGDFRFDDKPGPCNYY
ncbi:MAG TPA: tetratricopeptide repeat protein [Polyangia bacterium]|nr:tetratricopeptide repeat protein [Polyangia bacterium]